MEKKIKVPIASNIVVNAGVVIEAGSLKNLYAKKGINTPVNLERIITTNKDNEEIAEPI